MEATSDVIFLPPLQKKLQETELSLNAAVYFKTCQDMKLKDHFTDSISTAGGASLTQKADKGEAFKEGLDVFFTCIELCEALVWTAVLENYKDFVSNSFENPVEKEAGTFRH